MKKETRTKILDILFALIGIPGAFIVLYGQHSELEQLGYISGSAVLMMTAAWYKQFYFVAMELIQIAGHGASFLNVGVYIQFAIPLLLTIQLLIYYFMTGPLNTVFVVIGIVANCLLAIATSYENQWVYVIGGAGIAAYAYYCVFSKKQKICYMWAILNTIFALTALYKIMENSAYG